MARTHRTIAALAVLLLATCGDGESAESDSAAASEDTAASTDTAIADTATAEDVVTTADSNGGDTSTPADTNDPTDTARPADTASPVDTTCVPDCHDRYCGDDGCGGSCGECGAYQSCSEARCVSTIRYCTAPCTTVSDCVADDPPAGYDTANFTCTGGACRYTGCVSDTDCAVVNSTLGTGTCEPVGAGLDLCVASCSTPSDCTALSGVPAFDADNYLCEGGHCRYQGCNTDSECAQSYMDDSYGCNDVGLYPLCMKRCASPSDCVVPNSSALYDASHYACDAGFCQYTGCTSSTECDAAGLTGYVCTVP